MKGIEILNDSELLEQKREYMQRLSDVFNFENAAKPFLLTTCLGRSGIDMYREPENWVEDCLQDLARQYEDDRKQSKTAYRPLILMGKPYSVHFTDRVFGAEVFFDENTREWNNRALRAQVGKLKPADLETNETWELAKRIAAAFLSFDVKAPYFSMTTIASPLNILINLYGSQVLMDMILEPEAVAHDLDVITQAQEAMHRWYSDQIEPDQLQCTTAVIRLQPPGYSQLCGCSTQLISAELYNNLVRPCDERILRTHPNGGMIHLCGSHLQHLKTFKDMNDLQSIQLNDQAADDFKDYRNNLRENQVIYIRPTKNMTPAQITTISNGRPTVIVSDIQWGE